MTLRESLGSAEVRGSLCDRCLAAWFILIKFSFAITIVPTLCIATQRQRRMQKNQLHLLSCAAELGFFSFLGAEA